MKGSANRQRVPVDRYVLITGASRGLGRAMVRALHEKGFHVIAGVRCATDEQALRREFSERLETVLLDVTDRDQIVATADRVGEIVGESGLYGLVNNAGTCTNGPVEFLPVDEFRRLFEINLFGQIEVIQAMAPLVRRATGRIINMTSIAARMAAPYQQPYASSKAALEAVTESMFYEFGKWGISVVSILPGLIRTDIFDTTLVNSQKCLNSMPAEVRTYYGTVFEGMADRMEMAKSEAGQPEQVAAKVCRALTVANPRRRYFVGRDAYICGALWMLPPRVRGWLFAKYAE
jgi:NAD(P)-dependent dehydrogenase (short-subunit alcohol dehydrogenase family)